MNYDTQNYRMFTEKSEIDKAVSTLNGLVQGMYIDSRLNEVELNEFKLWYESHASLLNRQPFDEIVNYIDEAIADDFLSEEEIQDIQWLCQKLEGEYYTTVTSRLQGLQGVFHGILADGIIKEQEVNRLHEWMGNNQDLSGYYPFDEVYSLLNHILSDGIIDKDEKLMLQTFLLQFVDLKDQNVSEYILKEVNEVYSFKGICAVDPDINISGKKFCITGESSRASRKQITQMIVDHGGQCVTSISKRVNYVLVGDNGNPCWAYSCYGRKIEKAMSLRMEGMPIIILHENDFWDYLEGII